MKDLKCLSLPEKSRRNPLRALLASIVALCLPALPAFATPGLEGTFEYAIDAPWRIEPSPDGQGGMRYGKLPVVIAILDENVIRHDSTFPIPATLGTPQVIRPVTGLGNFGQVRIKVVDITRSVGSSGRTISSRTYSLNDLYEIEKSVGPWEKRHPVENPSPAKPDHRLCRVWAGDSIAGMGNLSNTSEWHALLWFDIPANLPPGTDLHIEAEVDVTGDRGLSYAAALSNPQHGPLVPANLITLKNSLKVHLAEAPLPRFDTGTWAYGDLHYHSQGSDNEGESGYSYRGVLHAMGALGLDFLFATDHASDSRQFVDADLDDFILGEIVDGVTGGEYDPDVTSYVGHELRDMNLERFQFLWELLNEGETAANTEIARGANGLPAQVTQTNGFAPQVFLGCELDTVNEAGPQDAARWVDWKPFYDVENFSVSPGNGFFEPEVNFSFPDGSFAETVIRAARLDETGTPSALEKGWTIRYGNGLEYSLFNLAGSYYPKESVAKVRHDNDLLDTFGPRSLRILSDYWQGRGGFEGYPIFDVQGINDILFTRAHLVYFPGDPEDRNAFISSQTGKYGGGTRPMVDRRPGKVGLFEEIEEKGFAFLAHSIGPVNPRSKGGNGPDGAPWSEHMYETAWSNPSILGLQFWNENVRSETEIEERDHGGREIGYEAPVGEFQDIKRFQRQGFLTGKFELFPFDSDTTWKHKRRNIANGAASLHHGSFTWDKILRWGLDREKTAALTWLPEGEPRKFFMAGGSDAHGDLNYRREGYLTGTSAITDSAIASVRNLVRVPSIQTTVGPAGTGTVTESRTSPGTSTGTTTQFSTTQNGTTTTQLSTGLIGGTFLDEQTGGSSNSPAPTLSQEDVTNALRAGQFCVTDGPILRIAIDENDNGVIDSADTEMGGTHGMFSLHSLQDDVTLLVEWKSTPEFGAIRKIDLYVGSHNSGAVTTGDGRTYAAPKHGPREGSRIPKSELDAGYRNASGKYYGYLTDNYWRDPSGKLRIELTEAQIAAGQGFSGSRAISLKLNDFPAGGGAGRHDIIADRHYIRAFATTYLPPIITFEGDDPAECFEHIIDKLVLDDPGAENYDPCDDLDIEVASVVHRGALPARYAFANPVWIKRAFNTVPAHQLGEMTELASEQNDPPTFPNLDATLLLGSIPNAGSSPASDLRVHIPADGGVMLNWTCVPNWTYAIEYSTDLQRWTQISSTSTTRGTGSFLDTDATRLSHGRGFYRLRLLATDPILETEVAVFRFLPRGAGTP